MKTNYLTEHEAWLKIARKGKKRPFIYGLCCEIGNLYSFGCMNIGTYVSMETRIKIFRKIHDLPPYFFPIKREEVFMSWKPEHQEARIALAEKFAKESTQ